MPQDPLKKLREKYPQYSDLEDSTLARLVVERYPQYGDIFAPYLQAAPRPEDLPQYGQRADIFQRELSRHPLFAPGQTLNKAISQFPDRPVAGGLNVVNALLQTAATPFTAGETILRQFPGGEGAADVLSAPFHAISRGVTEGERAIGGTLKALGIPDPKMPEAEALSGINQMLAQMLPFMGGRMFKGAEKPALIKESRPRVATEQAPTPAPEGLRTAGELQKTVEPTSVTEGAIPQAFRKKMIAELGAETETKFGKVKSLSDADLTRVYQEKGLDKPAPLSEAPVSRGGSMEVRGEANKAQIEKSVKPTETGITVDFGVGAGQVINAGVEGAKKALGDVSTWYKETKPFEFKESVPKKQLRERIYEWDGDYKVGLYNGKLLTENLRKNLPEGIRTEAPFWIEGTSKIAKPKIFEQYEPLIRQYFKDARDAIVESGVYDDVGFRENYVNRVWDLSDKKTKTWASRFTRQNPFLKERKIPTLEEGIKRGLKPKTTDIAELIDIYNEYAVKVTANLRLAKDLRNLVDETGQPLIQRIDKAPQDWPVMNSATLNRAIGHKQKSGELMIAKIPVRVHPEIARELNVVFQFPFNNRVAKAYQGLNAIAKKTSLSISLFHHFALSESSVASGIAGKMVSLWNPVEIVKAIRGGKTELPVFKNPELAKDGLRHGLELGSIPDVQTTTVRNILESAEAKFGKVVKPVRKFNDVWDKLLWDYYHSSLKLYAYEKQIAQAIKKNPNIPVEKIKSEVAKSVNDAFGGQNWTRLMVTPKMRQILQWSLLAPDWTTSNLRIFSRAFQSGALSKAMGKSPEAGRIQGQLGRRYWIRTGLAFYTMSNLLNYYFTQKDKGEGRYLWDNPEGQQFNIYVGKDDEGADKYIRLGKQFKEPFEWMTDPIRVFGSKLSPAIQIAVEQGTKHAVGSGFPSRFVDQPFFQSIPDRTKSIAEKFIPFSVRGNQFMMTAPTSKGTTPYKAAHAIKDAILEGDDERIKKMIKTARENNIDPQRSIRAALSIIRSEDVGRIRAQVTKLERQKTAGTITADEFKKRVAPLMREIEKLNQKMDDYSFLIR